MGYNKAGQIIDLDPSKWAVSGAAVGAMSGLLSPDLTTLEGSAIGGSFGAGGAVGFNIGSSLGSLASDYYGKDPDLGGIIGAGAGFLGGGALASTVMRKIINKHNENKRKAEYEEQKLKEYQDFLNSSYGVRPDSYSDRVRAFINNQ